MYSANATYLILEIYASNTGVDDEYDYAMAKGSDNVWRAAVAGVPRGAIAGHGVDVAGGAMDSTVDPAATE